MKRQVTQHLRYYVRSPACSCNATTFHAATRPRPPALPICALDTSAAIHIQALNAPAAPPTPCEQVHSVQVDREEMKDRIRLLNEDREELRNRLKEAQSAQQSSMGALQVRRVCGQWWSLAPVMLPQLGFMLAWGRLWDMGMCCHMAEWGGAEERACWGDDGELVGCGASV